MSARRKIAIDLTPLTEDSGMGGAKTLVWELIKNFGGAQSAFDYLLLTCEDTHETLAELDASNIQRVCVKERSTAAAGVRIRQRLHLWANRLLPVSLQGAVKRWYLKISAGEDQIGLFQKLAVDMLFCPFTGPIFHTRIIPTVSLIHDLQFLRYPEYFSPLDRMYLEEHFREAWQLSSRLITTSNFVKGTVLEYSHLSENAVSVVPISVHSRMPDKSSVSISSFGLQADQYLLYPAKFWPHKNHKKALAAFKRFRQEKKSPRKLVFTGFGPEDIDTLHPSVAELGLEEDVVILGWLDQSQLAALYDGCWAVLYPSLYEGFGIPILEAFQFNKPVLCSRAASLPEVAGDAALFFDPGDEADIARAILHLANHPETAAGLVEKGRHQLAKFSDSRKMAAQYEQVFSEVLGAS